MQNTSLLAYAGRLIFAIVNLQTTNSGSRRAHDSYLAHGMISNYLLGAESTNQKRHVGAKKMPPYPYMTYLITKHGIQTQANIFIEYAVPGISYFLKCNI